MRSVWQNLDSGSTTSHFLLKSFRYQAALRVTKEPYQVEWKRFVFFLEDCLIPADLVISFHDLVVSNQVLDYIYDTHGHRITQWNHQVLSQPLLQVYSDTIAAQGSALDNCFGFVDGTVRPICRPAEHQRAVYNGHKRVHALKFQCVALPNGLIGHLYGPVGKKWL